MKRWLYSFLLAVGVVFLLWIPHHAVSAHLHPQAKRGRSVLSRSVLVSSGYRALRTASPVFLGNRAGPLEIFATQYGSLLANDGLTWLDHRGPPGTNMCRQALVTNCKAAGPAGSLRGALSAEIPGRRRANSNHGVLQHALAKQFPMPEMSESRLNSP
jgi:hypothetical protein